MFRSTDPRISHHRARFVVLSALAALLLWDGAPLAVGAPPVGQLDESQDLALDDARRVREVMAELNPGLDPHTLYRIASAVVRYSDEYRLDPSLVTAIIRVESSGRPWVESPKGAIGLMQVMPHMMSPMGLAGNAATIESNIEAGCSILADNIRRLGEERGISAYFWGSNIRGVDYLERVRAAQVQVAAGHES